MLGFHSYFAAGHLVVEGQRIAKFYDDDWFIEQAARFEPSLRDIYNANTPTMALFYAPMAIFDSEAKGRLAWTLISIPLLIVFVEALIRISRASSTARPYWYAATFVAQPLEDNLRHGQAYLVVGLGLVLFLKWWRDDQQSRAGNTLGVLYAYKSAGLMLWPLALVTGRWRLLLSGLGAIVLIAVLTWPFVGADGWIAYFVYAREVSISPDHRVTAQQTVQSLIEHLLHGGATPGRPVVDLPYAIAHGVALAVILLMIGTTMYVARRRPRDDLSVGAATLLTLVALPETLLHSYTLALIPIAQLAQRILVIGKPTAKARSRTTDWKRVAFWVGAALIIVREPFLSTHFLDGWAAVLAYPKLYGGLLLWALCLVLLAGAPQALDSTLALQGSEPPHRQDA